MKLAILDSRIIDHSLKLDVGDEVAVILRATIAGVSAELVDVTAMGDRPPKLTLGEKTLELVVNEAGLMLAALATPRSLIELARDAGLEVDR